MSDSDEEVPLAVRRATNKSASAPPSKPAVKPSVKQEPLEDDVPLIQRKAAPKNQAPSKSAAKAKVKEEVFTPTKPAANSRGKGKNDGKVAVKKEDEKVKREKKEFAMPGQTRDTPPEIDPLRKFYTSLLDQMPESEMARKWCVQHGLLDRSEAEKWLEANKMKKPGLPLKSPSKPQLQSRSSGSSLNNGASKVKIVVKPAASQPSAKASRADTNGKPSAKRPADDSDDDRPLAKKAKPAAPKPAATKPAPPKPAAAKPAPKPAAKPKPMISDDDSEDDEPLVMKKTSRSAPPARNGSTSAAGSSKPAPPPPPSEPKEDAKPRPPPSRSAPPPPKLVQGPPDAGDDSSDEDMPLVKRVNHASR